MGSHVLKKVLQATNDDWLSLRYCLGLQGGDNESFGIDFRGGGVQQHLIFDTSELVAEDLHPVRRDRALDRGSGECFYFRSFLDKKYSVGQIKIKLVKMRIADQIVKRSSAWHNFFLIKPNVQKKYCAKLWQIKRWCEILSIQTTGLFFSSKMPFLQK